MEDVAVSPLRKTNKHIQKSAADHFRFAAEMIIGIELALLPLGDHIEDVLRLSYFFHRKFFLPPNFFDKHMPYCRACFHEHSILHQNTQ